MNEQNNERRQYPRHDIMSNVRYHFTCDIKTRVDFKSKDEVTKYSGFSKNFSAEGMCLISNVNLANGKVLQFEIYIEGKEQPVQMEGQVMWSYMVPSEEGGLEDQFETGIKLLRVDGKFVSETVYFDELNHVVWSDVLKVVFDDCEQFKAKRKKI